MWFSWHLCPFSVDYVSVQSTMVNLGWAFPHGPTAISRKFRVSKNVSTNIVVLSFISLENFPDRVIYCEYLRNMPPHSILVSCPTNPHNPCLSRILPLHTDHSPDIQHLLDKLQQPTPSNTAGIPPPDPKKNLLEVLEIYMDFTAYVLDPVTTEGIERSLRRNCASESEFSSNSASDKRSDEKVVGKKIKFHSWGGKRHQGNLEGGYRIITRTPFHSWGGKRANPSDPALYNDLY